MKAPRLGRPGNEFPGSSIGMSLRDKRTFADTISVLRPHDVPVPVGDIPMVEPGNSFPGRSRRALMRSPCKQGQGAGRRRPHIYPMPEAATRDHPRTEPTLKLMLTAESKGHCLR